MAEISVLIQQQLANLDAFAQARSVLAFYPMANRQEIDLTPLFKDKKQWYLPRITQDVSGEPRMGFYRYHSKDALCINRFGISEPSPDSPPLADSQTIDLIILPGLIFSPDGHRLGYGKGFYDAFLSRLKRDETFGGSQRVITVGVCPDKLLLPKLPIDPWDEPLDYVVTERQVIQVS